MAKSPQTDPNKIMLAENLAMHLTDTLYKVKLAKGKHGKPWNLIRKEERQDWIEACLVVLAAADQTEAEEMQKQPKKLNPIQQRIDRI
jgi:hypothetical protein